MSKSYYQRREDELKLLISEAKIRNHLTDKELAKKIGMPYNTFNKRKSHPGGLRVEYIWLIEKLAGRQLGQKSDQWFET